MYDVWKTVTLNNASQLITTIDHDIEKMAVDVGQMNTIAVEDRGTVVDFGCGVGRNIFYLSKICNKVYGFDFPNMLEMLQNRSVWKKYSNIELFSDWKKLSQLDYNTVYCCISLQHLCTKDILYYVGEFARKAKKLYVHGRDFNDYDNDKVCDIVSNFWEIDTIFGIQNTLEELHNLPRDTHYFVKWSVK